MLSICIPVYNVDVTQLVSELIKQGHISELELEILVFDDGSKPKYKNQNRHISEEKAVIYEELENNIGCASIRNLMATQAKFDNLLFIDSDSAIPANYLASYKKHLGKHLILCGGRKHPEQLPHPNKRLRWTVGKKREDYDAQTRSITPNKSFMSNNFMVQKELFKIIQFDDKIKRSGHEDTMMGIEMEVKKITIQHIDNAVIHIGLEDNQEFITKTKQRTETLLFLLKNKGSFKELMIKRIKLLKYFYLAKKTGMLRLFNYLYNHLHHAIELNLRSKYPNMLLFDLYKIGYLSKIYLREHK